MRLQDIIFLSAQFGSTIEARPIVPGGRRMCAAAAQASVRSRPSGRASSKEIEDGEVKNQKNIFYRSGLLLVGAGGCFLALIFFVCCGCCCCLSSASLVVAVWGCLFVVDE